MSDSFRLTQTAPRVGKVEVNGTDLARAVQRVEIDLDNNWLPEVTLHLAFFELDDLAFGQTRVVIPDATCDALIALGWTPPTDKETTT